jgi:translation initiation factor 5
MINIAGLTPVEDPSYRYKMPRLVPKVEGRGNGIKTVIVNVADIATSLNRDASEITKFFGCELGAQTTMSVEEDRFVVNGAHSSQDLQNLMGKYIEHFVLCKNCRLPETHYKVKGDLISQKCVACGSKDPCDMTHRLTTFIIKQHKKAKSEKSSEPSSSKDKKKKEKKSKDADEDEPPKKDEKKKSKKKKKEEEGGDEVVEDQEGDAESQAIGKISPRYVCIYI